MTGKKNIYKPEILKKAIHFRPIKKEDLPFLRKVYAGTRKEVQTIIDWTQEQKDAFIDQQFQAQHVHYQTHYQKAAFDLILLEEIPIGRLYIHRRKKRNSDHGYCLITQFSKTGHRYFFIKKYIGRGKEK